MKELKRLSFVVVTLLLSTMMAFAQKPNIHILATGGTIAGTGGSATSTNYTAGKGSNQYAARCSTRTQEYCQRDR